MKKFFSLVLALVMALSLTTVAFAATTEVTTSEQLAAALKADAEQIDVVLKNDISVPVADLSNYGQTPGSGEYKMGSENTKAINIDLGGYKLTLTTSYMTAIGAKNENATITIKNGSMNGTGNSAATWNINDLMFANCNYVFEDVTFDKEVALVNTGKTTTMKNVTIKGTGDYYALWIQAEGQTVEIDGLIVNTPGRGIKIDEQYVGDENLAKVTMNVSNAKFTTAKKSAIMVKSAAGADIAASNCNISGVAADSTNLVWVDSDATDYAGLVSVSGATGIAEGTTGHVAQLNGVKYEKLADAVAAAAAAGDTIELLADCDEDVTVGKELTFDFNGYTYSGVVTPAAGYTYMDGVVKKTPATFSGTTAITSSFKEDGTYYVLYNGIWDEVTYVPADDNGDGTGNVAYFEGDLANYIICKKNDDDAMKLTSGYLAGDKLLNYVKVSEVEYEATATAVNASLYATCTTDINAKGYKVVDAYGAVTYYKDPATGVTPTNWLLVGKEIKGVVPQVEVTDYVMGGHALIQNRAAWLDEAETIHEYKCVICGTKFNGTTTKAAGVTYVPYFEPNAITKAAYEDDGYDMSDVDTGNLWLISTKVPSGGAASTDKTVTSAETFDAGIAMYVGMSVMAAAGSAVVIGKKKD